MKRVLIGMSGGVDSSACAIILKNKGYDVIGATMQLWDNTDVNSNDAKSICDKLNVKHYTIDFKEQFKNCVIRNFIEQYMSCKTPNPCVQCNKYLKFNAMYNKAKELGCDYLATGHYAKIEYSNKYKRYVLKKATNRSKDQSYVLYNIPTHLLEYIIFPLQDIESKEETRKLVKEYNLNIATKADSQDICFIPDGNYKNFLKNNNVKANEGNIIYHDKIIGKHTGLYKYTIGQRKGLGISNETPLYVIGFNGDKNELIVGDEKDLYVKSFKVKDYNLLLIDDIEKPMKVNVKTRYKSKEYEAMIKKDNDLIDVEFVEPQKGITPGQSAVFYIDDIVLGGGIII